MKYVIDASIGFKWEVPENLSDKSLALRDEFRRGVHELLAPDFFPIEIGNSLLIAERRGRLPAGSLSVMYADLMANLPIIYPAISLFPRAIDIASQTRATVYDSLYVALAEREGCELVTADEKLVKLLPGFPLLSLASL